MMKNYRYTKNKWLIFMGLAIIFCLFCGCKKQNTATVSYRPGSAIKNKVDKDEALDDLTILEDEDLYIIEEIDMGSENLSVYSISEDKQMRMKYNMTTKFQDKYKDSCSVANFTPGTVVEIGEKLPSSKAISSVTKSDAVWVYEDVVNYEIDSEKHIFETGKSNYKITKKTKCYSDFERLKPDEIGENDVLTVIGIDKEILSIAVTTGHGYIQLCNTVVFDDSLIFIGDKIVTKIEGDDLIEVPEGIYKITVANDGWGGSGEYEVLRDDITVVDLDDLKGEGPSYCDITFEVVVPDTFVYLDGKLVDTDEIQSVRYGKHKLKVECSGYVSWDKTLVVNSESATITLVMMADTGANGTLNTYSNPTENTENTNQNTDGETDNTVDGNGELPEGSNTNNSTDSSVPVPVSPADNNRTNKSTETSRNSTKKKSNSSTTPNTNYGPNNDENYDYETDYLSTVSDMLSNLMN